MRTTVWGEAQLMARTTALAAGHPNSTLRDGSQPPYQAHTCEGLKPLRHGLNPMRQRVRLLTAADSPICTIDAVQPARTERWRLAQEQIVRASYYPAAT